MVINSIFAPSAIWHEMHLPITAKFFGRENIIFTFTAFKNVNFRCAMTKEEEKTNRGFDR